MTRQPGFDTVAAHQSFDAGRADGRTHMPISQSSERSLGRKALSVVAVDAGVERAHDKRASHCDSQRALVIASLIRCPERGPKASARV